MGDSILAIVTIVYALVCLTKESDHDQAKRLTLKSAEDYVQKGAGDELETVTAVERK